MNNIILEFFIISLMILVMLYDLYSQYIRANISNKKTNQLIAKANWVQYQARILTMISIVVLTYAFEKKLITFNIIRLLSFGFAISSFIGLLYIYNKKIHSICNYILRIPTFFSFKETYGEDYHINIKFITKKAFTFSLLFNLMIGFAIAVPFILASNNPEMRMTAAYIGQLLNFAASIINFNLIEPKFYKALDDCTESLVASQIIISKVISSIIISLVLFAM